MIQDPVFCFKSSIRPLVRAYYHTYGLPVVISNCSNNYGPAQHYEKLIPLMIQNIVNKKSLPGMETEKYKRLVICRRSRGSN